MGLRRFFFVVMLAAGCAAHAQSGALPDAPAPSTAPAPAPSPLPDAAVAPQAAPPPASSSSPANANPFPDEQEKAAPVVSPNAPPAQPKNNDASQQNPFPEDREKTAPLSQGAPEPDPAANKEEPAKPAAEPGWSSSSDKPKLADEGSSGSDPKAVAERTAHDVQVAKLYYGLGNWEGAYLRYRDALAADPKNADAAMGLADTERRMGRYVNARTHYGLYLQLQPDGRYAHQAQKALEDLPQKDAAQPAPAFAPRAQMP